MGGGVLSVLGSHVIDLLTYLDLGRYTSILSATACTLKSKDFITYSRVMRVNATLKTVTTTTDNIGGIRQDLYSENLVLKMKNISKFSA